MKKLNFKQQIRKIEDQLSYLETEINALSRCKTNQLHPIAKAHYEEILRAQIIQLRYICNLASKTDEFGNEY